MPAFGARGPHEQQMGSGLMGQGRGHKILTLEVIEGNRDGPVDIYPRSARASCTDLVRQRYSGGLPKQIRRYQKQNSPGTSRKYSEIGGVPYTVLIRGPS